MDTKDSIVVVGGGTMGLFIAHELMSRGKKIVLIESGNEQSKSFDPDEYSSIGHAHTGIAIGRAKGVGGTTNLWGGQLTEFLPVDVESKGNFNQPDWNISWKELEHYYPKTYKKLGFQGEVSDYAETLSTTSGKTLEFFYTHWLKQPNFKFHFYQQLKESPLVTVYEDTTVTDLKFSGKKCVSIELVTEGKKSTSIANFDKIILANGTFEICRLLLAAAKKAGCPFSDNQWIGKYYQDHIVLGIGSIQNASK